MFERFTAPAREVVVHAQEEARELHNHYIGTEHLLLALLHEDSGVPFTVLTTAGATSERVRADIARLMGSEATPPLGAEDAEALRGIGIDLNAVLARIEERFGSETQMAAQAGLPARRRGLLRRHRRDAEVRGHVPFTRRAKKVLELALREAVALGSPVIGSEHILLGLISEGNGLAAKVLVAEGIALGELRQATLRLLDRAA